MTPEELAHDSSYAYSLYPPNYWDILDILVIVEKKEKSISTTNAHKLAHTSPFFQSRLTQLDGKINKLKQALRNKNFDLFGQIAEAETLNMHAVMMTASPPLFYWLDKTIEIIKSVWQWRKNGLSVYFTIDAGPNVHLLCEGKNKKAVVYFLNRIKNIKQIIINKPGTGAKLVDKHIF